MRSSEHLIEAERVMTICNACRYCEGHCAVFPAMEKRLSFAEMDLDYLANLCHNCGSCFHHCQYAEPHEFKINVPRTFSELRHETYAQYTFPSFMGKTFQHNTIWAAVSVIIGFIVLFALTSNWNGSITDNFYDIISHNTLVVTFGGVGLYVVLALTIGIVRYWRSIGLASPLSLNWSHIGTGIKHALSLKYMGGGMNEGCTYPTETPSNTRRVFHHLTFYGFMLCFAATSVGTGYHYLLDWVAPYGFLTLPKFLGITGGIGLIIGPLGLFWLGQKADAAPKPLTDNGMDRVFLVLLLLTSVTGMVLMLTKGTLYLAPALIVHLGVVFALFLTLPYGKFVHGFYRLIALIKYASETKPDEIH